MPGKTRIPVEKLYIETESDVFFIRHYLKLKKGFENEIDI